MAVKALGSFGLAAAFCLAAGAQPRGPQAPEGWEFTLGGGAIYAPDYEGSDDYEVRALPFISVRYQDWLSFSVPEGLKATVVSEGGFKAGLLAGYRFDRDSGDNLALAGWGDVDGAIELGAFAQYRVGPIVFDADIRQDVSGAHEGLIAKLAARFATPVAGAMLSIGPQVTWADDNYTQTYFGITPVQAAASAVGHPVYVADGGIKDYGVSAMVRVPLDDQWSVTAMASVSQLTGDAADSPIVAVWGSETQFMGGLFVAYRF